MEERLAELEQRLARAERRARLMFGVSLASLLGAMTLVAAKPAVTQTDGSTVKAPFRVVDAQGKPVLRVDAGPSGGRLSVLTNEGYAAAFLVSAADGSLLALRERATGGGVRLSSSFHGAELSLFSPERKRLATFVASDKDRLLAFYDPQGNTVFKAP